MGAIITGDKEPAAEVGFSAGPTPGADWSGHYRSPRLDRTAGHAGNKR